MNVRELIDMLNGVENKEVEVFHLTDTPELVAITGMLFDSSSVVLTDESLDEGPED